LTPGGSSTVHIYTQTVHRTTQLTTLVGRLSGIQTQSSQTNWEECGPCPIFASYTLAFALQLRRKHGKTSFRVAEECQLARWKRNVQNGTYITIRIDKHNNKSTCMNGCIGFKTFFYVVRHLDSIASYLPTCLHLGFFRSWPSLFLPSSFSSVFLVLSFVSASTSVLFLVVFILPFFEHGHTMYITYKIKWKCTKHTAIYTVIKKRI